MQTQKYIVWSYDTEACQVLIDVVRARSTKEASSKVARKRPYAILDSLVPALLLSEHIRLLQRALERD
jgi:hypothetical protein